MKINSRLIVVALVFVSALLSACNKGSGGNPASPSPSSSSLTVRVVIPGVIPTAVSEAEVTLSGPVSSHRGITDLLGRVVFEGVVVPSVYGTVVRGFGIVETVRVVQVNSFDLTIEVPGKTDVKIISVNPACGSTISYGQAPIARVRYRVENILSYRGPVYVELWMSQDGVNPLGGVTGGMGVQSGGEGNVSLASVTIGWGESFSSYFVNRIVVRSEDSRTVVEELARHVYPCELRFAGP